jgi:zinc/manganese transport system substrate-binding protein
MLATGDHGLVAGSALAHLDSLNEADAVKEVQGAVDAGRPHPIAARPQPLGDLLRGEAAILVGEQVDDGAARAAGALPSFAKGLPGERRPVDLGLPRHRTEDTPAVRMIIIPRMYLRTIFISVIAASSIALAACGDDDDSGSGDAPNVVATTGIVADIVEAVAGPDADVEQVIPDGSSPHDFELSAQDRQVLEEADLVVASGAGLEAGIPLDDVDAPQWALADHAGELLAFEEAGAHEHAEDEHAADDGDVSEEEHAADEEHEHGSEDPHVWMDPTRVAAAAPTLADALAEADPAGADGYRKRARAYADELDGLDAELDRTLASVPDSDRELVTSHDSLGYFADRYGFEVVATAFPASGPEAEASAGLIDEVEGAVNEHEVPAVFAQEEDDPETLRLIADETGVAIEEGLIIESPGTAGSYEEMLRRDAELIAAALSQ